MTVAGLPVLALATGLPLVAPGASGLYPAADCAALRLGFGDYARRSVFLDGANVAYDVAYDTVGLFHAAAIHQTGDNALVDTHIGRARVGMELMVEASIEIGDSQNRDVFEHFFADL